MPRPPLVLFPVVCLQGTEDPVNGDIISVDGIADISAVPGCIPLIKKLFVLPAVSARANACFPSVCRANACLSSVFRVNACLVCAVPPQGIKPKGKAYELDIRTLQETDAGWQPLMLLTGVQFLVYFFHKRVRSILPSALPRVLSLGPA